MLARCLVGFVIAATTLDGLAEEPHKRWLSFMAGQWEGTFEDGRTGPSSFQVIGDTNALTYDGHVQDFSIAGVIGWRADTKKFVETGYVVDHKKRWSLDREYYHVTDDTIKGKQTARTADGTVTTHQLEWRRVNGNEMTLTGHGDGTSWTVAFKRVFSDDAFDPIDAHKKHRELMTRGVWVSDGEIMVHKHVSRGQFVEIRPIVGESDVTVYGIDPKTGKLKYWSFSEDGAVAEWTCTSYRDGCWTYEGHVVGPDGRKPGAGIVRKLSEDKINVVLELGDERTERVWSRR